jgi:hypothetical protein
LPDDKPTLRFGIAGFSYRSVYRRQHYRNRHDDHPDSDDHRYDSTHNHHYSSADESNTAGIDARRRD